MVFHTQPKFWFLFLLFPSGKQQKSSSYQSFLYNLDFNTLLQLKRNFLLVTRSLLLFTRYSLVFFFYLGFLSRTFMIYRTAGEGGANSLSPLYHFLPLHRHLDISRAITTESSPLHIASSRTRAQEPLFSERKSLTTKLHTPDFYLLLVTSYSLLVTFYSLLVVFYSLLVTFYSLLVTFYLFIVTCYFILVTFYSLLVGTYLLLVASYSVLVTFFVQHCIIFTMFTLHLYVSS